MRNLVTLLLLLTAVPAFSISDRTIRRQAAAIGKLAQAEPPLMALDTLLQTAVAVQPYVPAEANRLYVRAKAHARKHPGVAWNARLVRLWMTLDPEGGEAALTAAGCRMRATAGLIAYHNWRGHRERAAELAVEMIRAGRVDPFDLGSALATVAALDPVQAADLFQELSRDPKSRSAIPELAARLLDALLRTAETTTLPMDSAVKRIREVFESDDYGRDAKVLITTQFELDGRKVDTKDNRSTALETLTLVDRMADEKTRKAAQQALRTRRTRFSSSIRTYTRRKAIAPDLSLDEALAQMRSWEPANERVGQLWRYMIGKPRTEDEARPMIAALIDEADRAPVNGDPFWFLQSTLNLDGRLGPPGRQWVLPPALRPDVFRAAARVGQKVDRDPERYEQLTAAMREEKVPVPAGLASAQARMRLAALRSELQTRYDFRLTSLDGAKRSLKAERGKVVVMNFWATWCGPCRKELPVLGCIYENLRKDGVEIFAITDEPMDTVKRFAASNPVSVPVLLDEGGRVFDHHRIVARPQTMVLDGTGRMVEHFTAEATEEQIRGAIAKACLASPRCDLSEQIRSRSEK